MPIQLGQMAPDFEQDSSEGNIRFHDWLGDSWAVLFSHPKDFTPICTTELGEVSRLRREWDRRGVKTIALSVDPADSHRRWIADIDETQHTRVDYPILADHDRKVATLYGMVHPESDPMVTVRSLFVIDPDKKVRLILAYPLSVGRNFAEILRAIDALQLTDARQVDTPANWKPGDEVVVSLKLLDEEAAKLFPQGYTTLKPYLRLVRLEVTDQ